MDYLKESMEKRWVIKEKGDSVVVRQLAAALGVTESLANLMVQRRINSPAERCCRQDILGNIKKRKDPCLWRL
jgi:hypothetical protein